MKRLAFLAVMVLGLVTAVYAGDKYTHDVSVLPEAARTVINGNFDAGVSVIKVEKTIGIVAEYEVVLTDGTEITFDRSGNWENIETPATKAVPEVFVPVKVKEYVTKNHPGTMIVGIEKESSGYEVELSTGIDLKFNKEGGFVKYDD